MEKMKKNIIISILISIFSIILIIIILLNSIFFQFFWNQELRNLLPNFEFFFRYITELGGTLIYLGIFFTLFWGINKKLARNLILIYISSNFVNFYAKAFIGNPRPDQSNWILIEASHLSTPSGHAMSSTVVWGYVGVKMKNILTLTISLLIIFLVSLSRMYLGVHWLGDILTGWLFGLIVLLLANIIEHSEIKLGKNKNFNINIFLIVFGFIALILTELFNISSYNFGTVGGQFIGIGIGFILEQKFVNFDIELEKMKSWKIITRIFIGIVIVAIIYLGLYLVIDSDIFWQVTLQYILVFLVGIFLWPFIFQKLNL
ncbi:MAG: phosphatase PAP2 family protein [Promethearchaeati archaeon]